VLVVMRLVVIVGAPGDEGVPSRSAYGALDLLHRMMLECLRHH
jgi:hypothetical protein